MIKVILQQKQICILLFRCSENRIAVAQPDSVCEFFLSAETNRNTRDDDTFPKTHNKRRQKFTIAVIMDNQTADNHGQTQVQTAKIDVE